MFSLENFLENTGSYLKEEYSEILRCMEYQKKGFLINHQQVKHKLETLTSKKK